MAIIAPSHFEDICWHEGRYLVMTSSRRRAPAASAAAVAPTDERPVALPASILGTNAFSGPHGKTLRRQPPLSAVVRQFFARNNFGLAGGG